MRRPPHHGPVLLTSSVGGHFTELEHLVESLHIDPDDRHWAVPRHSQTLHVLGDADTVTWTSRIHSRDLAGVRRNLREALALHRRLRPSRVVSTGAAQSIPHLLAAARHGTPITYVESVARLDGPSITGRVAALLPRTRLLAPRPGWGGRWEHAPDAFSAFIAVPSRGVPELTTATVALGSEKYQFPRALRQVDWALGGVPVTWQVGSTEDPRGVARNQWLSPGDLKESMATSSVVVTHGGAGSILTALAAGRVPVVLPRLAEHDEHCDDHQVRMSESLQERGLVVMVPPGQRLHDGHLKRAMALRAKRLVGQPIAAGAASPT